MRLERCKRTMPIALIFVAMASNAMATDLIVSANDGKFVRVDGIGTYPRPAPSDSLAIIDADQHPPVIRTIVEGIDHTLQGPPQAVAITPSGNLAIVGAPSHYDDLTGKETFETFLQIIDLDAEPAKLVERIDIGAHTNGLAINPKGTLLLATTLDGSVEVLSIKGKTIERTGTIKVSSKRLSGISFTHDGKAALVALRDEGGLAVLDVNDQSVSLANERISTGLAPYSVDVSSDGHFAVVSNVGLLGTERFSPRQSIADQDTVTLIDVSQRPFRAIQHLNVPATPEAAALSPDGQWIAVQAMGGSNLPSDNPARQRRGKLILFAIRNNEAVKTDEIEGGEAAQGLVFSKDSQTIFVQFNVERKIVVYNIASGKLVESNASLALKAGPASLRTMPR